MGRRKKKVVEEVKIIQPEEQPVQQLEAEEIPDIQLEVSHAPDVNVLIESSVNKDCVICEEPDTIPVVEVQKETSEELLASKLSTPKAIITEALDVFPDLVSSKQKVDNKVKSMIANSEDLQHANKLQKLRMISARLRSNRTKTLSIKRFNSINAKFSIK